MEKTEKKLDYGRTLELQITGGLNDKLLSELPEHWQNILKRLFPGISDDARIHANLFHDPHAKPDIVISYKHVAKKVSIKCGRNPTVHMENYNCFMRCIRLFGATRFILEYFELYHFGKTARISKNGEAYTHDELLVTFADEFEQVNKMINANKELLREIVYRGVIKGYNEGADEIDCLYYGNFEQGFMLTKEEIYDAILNDKKNDRGPLHFGGLIYQPGGRREDRVDRYYSKLKWPILAVKFYVPDII